MFWKIEIIKVEDRNASMPFPILHYKYLVIDREFNSNLTIFKHNHKQWNSLYLSAL